MLHTLGFRIPAAVVDDLLGSVVTYPLTEDFQHAWSLLPKKRHDGRPYAQPRYAALATALAAVHNQPVRMLDRHLLPPEEYETGTRALLTTTAPFRPRVLATAVRAWEQAARGGDDLDRLSPLLPPPAAPRPLSSGIHYRPGQVPRADGWVYETVAWQLMSHVAAAPLSLPGHRRDLALRPDTEGALAAWDDVICAESRSDDSTRKFGAMLRITVRLVTLPGVSDLVAVFDAHMSRLTDRWNKVRHAWIRRSDDDPLLRIAVRSVKAPDDRWRQRPRDYTIDVVAACGLDPIDLPENLLLPHGDVRALVPGPRFHPIGKGVGPRMHRHVHDHIVAALPGLRPLTAERTPERIFAPRVVGPPPAPALAAAVAATGHERLRLVCLYATPDARRRMRNQLVALSNTPDVGADDDETYPLTANATVVFRRRPALLAHGATDRAALLSADAVPEFEPTAGPLTAAWVETEWHPAAAPEPGQDAKPALRRLLGRVDVPTQFLATTPAEVATQSQPSSTQLLHAARMGVRDLLRSAGILDHRLARAAAAAGLPAPFDTPSTLVGIHARRQYQGDDRPPVLVLCLIAIHTASADETAWHVEFFHRDEWVPYGIGTARFHATAIGDASLGRSAEKAENTRRHVEGALTALLARTAGRPTTVFVDAEESRTIWPGLQNDRFGDGPLPGDTLTADGFDVAMVRCNDNAEVPRPTHRIGEGRMPSDPRRPAAPERRLYRFPDAHAPVWYLPRSSVTYQSKGGDLGARYTRWTLPSEIAHLNRDDWHSHRATEIAVVDTGTRHGGGRDPFDLAVLAARLSEQAAVWDHRTRHPSPLHLAVNADRDHPEHRSPALDGD